MQTEFEATFLKIDKDNMRRSLKEAGAILVYPETLLKRDVFDPPLPIKGGWLRVRHEANGVTMSLKIVDGDKIENQKEIELKIDDYKQGAGFLLAIGARHKSYQETKRELWNFMDTQVTIDTWPGLQPFVEIESDDGEKVKQAAVALGFDYAQAYFGAVDVVYEEELNIPFQVINQMPVITFEDPPQRYCS
ncbi:MAG: CYTH domain-containing protein [Candidatus Magasanikbacteria bacterium]|nr:CYTH domain-containing protein [Candidatus Magasanikbacteria bacterium]